LFERIFKRIRLYKPRHKETPEKILPAEVTAWRGLEQIIKDVIQQSGCGTKKCLEFGVEFGYSTVALSNYFEQVTGVDIFTGDPHAGFHGDIYEQVKSSLAAYPNIRLVQSDYKDFIKDNSDQYDLIHVDIIHTYEATYDCGLWAAQHSVCTLFHDTESFPEVKRAVADIARKTGKTFYNYPYHDGLGILY
jgi:hypothetical protein